ncbi:hypothetical protein F2981_08550 [Sinorhizobium meliloti]|nr:hypothetical protein [Sinorhizobium meliloti]
MPIPVRRHTALRFHPLEILLSMIWKSAVIILLGAPHSPFSHVRNRAQCRGMFQPRQFALPKGADRLLRQVIVTPDMHRSHSVRSRETDFNYGFNLSVWDRLFSTYVAHHRAATIAIETGLKAYGRVAPVKLLWSLILPFRRR